MPIVRKRRPAAATQEASSAEEATPPPAARRRRQASSSADVSSAAENGEATQTQGDPTSREQMVKKMVRLALACEYARLPIRRADVGVKVLGEAGARQFKHVFEAAQKELRQTFGMQMVELPVKEKVTVTQRRAAQQNDKPATTSKSWILTSTLPAPYRSNPLILPPSKAPTSATESTYTALYTFLISLISLSGGTLPEAKIDRYLKRVNADQYTPLEKTEKLLARMVKEGYLVRDKDTSGGDEVIEYRVGPRGKVEVGDEGVSGLVREVYGGVDAEQEDLDQRLERSLGLKEREVKEKKDKAKREALREEAEKRKMMKGKGKKRLGGEESSEEEEEEEQESSGESD